MRGRLRELYHCTREKVAKRQQVHIPISLTNLGGKILERIIAHNLNDYREANNMPY